MKQFEIKSKVYCTPSRKTNALFIILNIAVVFVVIYSIATMLVDGVSVGRISGCIAAIVVAFLFRTGKYNRGHYEFCVLSVKIECSDIVISYLTDNSKQITVDIGTIKSLEYSDQLQCLRLICDYQEADKSKKTSKTDAELLLYISHEDNPEFYSALAEASGREIIFVDREK